MSDIPPTDDVLDFDAITVHIDLPLNDQGQIPADDQRFLRQCARLSSRAHVQASGQPSRGLPTGKISLHIHKAPAPYEEVVGWFQTIFDNGTAAAAFLGGSLLSIATADLGDHARIRSVAATGAVLFILLFLLCSGCTLLFAFAGGDIAKTAGGKGVWSRVVKILLSALSISLQALPIAGVCCLFRVLQDYVSGAGLVGFGFTLVAGAITVGLWVGWTGGAIERYWKNKRQSNDMRRS